MISINPGEKMPEEIRCPECGSMNIKKIPCELPEGAEYYKYECLDCGLVFLESNLRE